MNRITKLPISARLVLSLLQQVRQAKSSLHLLWKRSISSWMTILVLGLSLSLPAALHVIVNNFQAMSFIQKDAMQVNVYAKLDRSDIELEDLLKELKIHKKVAHVSYISQEEALNAFQADTGLQNIMSYLDENPLPATFVITPVASVESLEELSNLVSELSRHISVQEVRVNMDWLLQVKRIMHVFSSLTYVLSALLMTVVVFVIHNTARLSIMRQEQEIKVMRLVGATDGFIRRPFLYIGLWYGFFAGLIAWSMINVIVLWLDSFFQSVWKQAISMQLQGLTLQELGILIFIASFLGWIASFWSVQNHLKDIDESSS